MSYQIATASRNSILQFCCQQNTMKQNLKISNAFEYPQQGLVHQAKGKTWLGLQKKSFPQIDSFQKGVTSIYAHTPLLPQFCMSTTSLIASPSLSLFIIHYPPGNAILLFKRNRDQILHSDIAQNFHAHRRAPMWVIYQSTWVVSQVFHYG